MNYFKPNFMFSYFGDISTEWLKENNITTILSDVDCTLIEHDGVECSTFEAWNKKLKEANIRLILVSNNNQKRVDDFAKNYGLKGYGHCKKPSVQKLEEIIQKNNINKAETIFLGDQIFTDVWCGKRLNVKTVLVRPLGFHEPFITRCKRGIEKKLIQKWSQEM